MQWNYALGDVVTALIAAGMRIDSLRELDVSVLRKWDGMEPDGQGMFRMAADRPSTPLMYGPE